MNRKTIVKKILFLDQQALLRHAEFLKSYLIKPAQDLQFDEMETHEKSKYLPLSIPLLVEAHTRKILGIGVCRMPAKGNLAEISRKKYGKRVDERSKCADVLFTNLSPYIHPNANLLTDENPKYASWIRKRLPGITHQTTLGRRGCVTGQGELKRGGFDPLFSLNHTAAMIRANINRMLRRTWCTTQRPDRLLSHLRIYMDYHNRVLT